LIWEITNFDGAASIFGYFILQYYNAGAKRLHTPRLGDTM